MRINVGITKKQMSAVAALFAAFALVAGTGFSAQAPVETPVVGIDQGQQGEQGEQQGEQASQGAAQAQATTQPMLTPEEQEALALVEQIIRDQEGVILGTAFDYDPGGRRDPFSSLIVGRPVGPGDRPPGLPGFLISEIDLKAVATAQGRWHAMVTGPDTRAYFLEVGTVLWDGHVITIEPGEVVFQQEVPDLMGARRTREVPKRLRTDSGGGRTP